MKHWAFRLDVVHTTAIGGAALPKRVGRMVKWGGLSYGLAPYAHAATSGLGLGFTALGDGF
jgi:hypothetical protein